MNRWKHKLPTREKIFESRFFKPFTRWFDDVHFWAFERESVARAVAVGLFCGMMPTPTQFAFAFIDRLGIGDLERRRLRLLKL